MSDLSTITLPNGDLYNLKDGEARTKLSSIQDGAQVNVQSDWDEVDSTADSFIANKPSILDLERGINIPDNSDLNDYTTIGNYYVEKRANAATITNSPTVGSGYILKVLEASSSNGFIIQIVFTNDNCEVYKRYYNIISGFTSWYKYYSSYDDSQFVRTKRGTGIEGYTDLNTIKEVGNYFCTDAATAQTLTNSPVSVGFILKVIESASGNVDTPRTGYRIQILIPQANSISLYTRYYRYTNDTWYSWNEYIPAPHFQIITYTYAFTNLAAGAKLTITANNFGMSTPSGYTPIAVLTASGGNATNIEMTYFNGNASGTGGAMAIKNNTAQTRSYTATLRVLYAKNNLIVPTS